MNKCSWYWSLYWTAHYLSGLYGLYTVAGNGGSDSRSPIAIQDRDDPPEVDVGGTGKDMSVGDNTLLLAMLLPPTLDIVSVLILFCGLLLLGSRATSRCSALSVWAMCSGRGRRVGSTLGALDSGSGSMRTSSSCLSVSPSSRASAFRLAMLFLDRNSIVEMVLLDALEDVSFPDWERDTSPAGPLAVVRTDLADLADMVGQRKILMIPVSSSGSGGGGGT